LCERNGVSHWGRGRERDRVATGGADGMRDARRGESSGEARARRGRGEERAKAPTGGEAPPSAPGHGRRRGRACLTRRLSGNLPGRRLQPPPPTRSGPAGPARAWCEAAGRDEPPRLLAHSSVQELGSTARVEGLGAEGGQAARRLVGGGLGVGVGLRASDLGAESLGGPERLRESSRDALL
jgi:hypothetical protein